MVHFKIFKYIYQLKSQFSSVYNPPVSISYNSSLTAYSPDIIYLCLCPSFIDTSCLNLPVGITFKNQFICLIVLSHVYAIYLTNLCRFMIPYFD